MGARGRCGESEEGFKNERSWRDVFKYEGRLLVTRSTVQHVDSVRSQGGFRGGEGTRHRVYVGDELGPQEGGFSEKHPGFSE